MDNVLYFFKPLKGDYYEDGWNGLRTLVVGVAHICTLPCPHHRICSNPDTVRNMDRKCPVYEGKSEYYLLSNSNEIEIRSFIDGEAKYPSYSAFTYYMTGSKDTLSSSVKPEFHRSGWYKALVEKHLGKCIKTSPEKNIKIIAEIIEQCVQNGYLGTLGDSLYFRNSDKYKWATRYIGWFIWKLKTTFGLGQGANEALAKLFNEHGMTHYSTDISKAGDANPLYTAITNLFESK